MKFKTIEEIKKEKIKRTKNFSIRLYEDDLAFLKKHAGKGRVGRVVATIVRDYVTWLRDRTS
jgi:hypothetical protein